MFHTNFLFFIEALDEKNIVEIEKFINNIYKNKKNNKKDFCFELYNNNLLTMKRLQFLINYSNKYYNISSNFIKILIKDKNVSLLNIIFNHLKFYDNSFILQLLFYYKNKITISQTDLIQLISNGKFKILINTEYYFDNHVDKYLENE